MPKRLRQPIDPNAGRDFSGVMPQLHFEAYFQRRVVEPNHRGGEHAHDGFEMLYILEGSQQVAIRGKTYVASPGDLLIYYPGEVHDEYISPGPFHLICLRFPKEFIPERMQFPGKDVLAPVVNLPWKERFRSIFEQIVVEHRGVDQFSRVLVGTYLAQFVALLWRALSVYKEQLTGPADENALRIGAVIDIVNKQIDLSLSLQDLAAKVHMSESHFSHVFKDVVGESPKRYVIRAKLEKARELLLHGDQSVVDISIALGYENPGYFSRLFKKEFGIAPGEFRSRERPDRRKVH